MEHFGLEVGSVRIHHLSGWCLISYANQELLLYDGAVGTIYLPYTKFFGSLFFMLTLLMVFKCISVPYYFPLKYQQPTFTSLMWPTSCFACVTIDLSASFILGLAKLEELNLKFTLVTDDGLQNLTGLTRLKSLNLDVRQITDSSLAVLTGKP